MLSVVYPSTIVPTNFFEVVIFTWTGDLQDERAVCDADLYQHRHCTTTSVQSFQCASRSSAVPPKLTPKQRAWDETAPELEQRAEQWAKAMDSSQFHNRDVKIFLIRHFGSHV